MKLSQTMFCAALVAIVTLTALPLNTLGVPNPKTNSSIQQAPITRHALPFSIEHVLAYFEEAFGKGPNKVDGARFEFVMGQPPGESTSISVSEIDQHIKVVLLATGDTGVTYIREFFEAPMFQPKETEWLYTLLDSGPGTGTVDTGRFLVEVSILKTKSWIVVSLDFSSTERP